MCDLSITVELPQKNNKLLHAIFGFVTLFVAEEPRFTIFVQLKFSITLCTVPRLAYVYLLHRTIIAFTENPI